MTKYQFISTAYTILENSFTDKRKEYIDSKPGLSGTLYCSFVNFVSNYIGNYKYCTSWGETYEVGRDILGEEALHMIIKSEADIGISRDICKEIVKYLNENKDCIEYYDC